MSEIEIRTVREEDAASFCSTVDAVAQEGRWLGGSKGKTLAEAQAYITENLAAENPHFVAVDHADPETIIGWADIVRMLPESRRHCGILGMGVLSAHRGQGLGRALLAAALEHADALPMDRVELSVVADNTAGIVLYERMGFLHEGVRRRAWQIGERTRDLVMMARTHPDLLPEIMENTASTV